MNGCVLKNQGWAGDQGKEMKQMGLYLLGVTQFCRMAVEAGAVKLQEVDGLFDNDPLKIGTSKYGMKIERPRYIPDVEVAITLNEQFHLEVIRQLLKLGYRNLSIIFRTPEGFEKRKYDFGHYDFPPDDKCMVVLYLENRSYSGICAVDYMMRNRLVKIPSDLHIVTYVDSGSQTDQYFYAAMADYSITERTELKGHGKSIQLWHGFPFKAMEHMVSDYVSTDRRVSNFWHSYDFIASYGKMYTNFMSACYGTLASQYVVTGMPRNDLLFVTDGRRNLRDLLPDSEGKKIIFYMPTFRKVEAEIAFYARTDGSTDGYLFYWQDFSVDILEKFCERNNIYFVFKLHPSDASKVRTWHAHSDHIGVITDEDLSDKCIYEYLNAADVLISDYSSVYFDYLLLDRPILFTDKDIDDYAANRGIMLEPLELWRPGAVVHTMNDLMAEIEEALDGRDLYKAARARTRALVHHYVDGRSTQRLLDFISEDWGKANG